MFTRTVSISRITAVLVVSASLCAAQNAFGPELQVVTSSPERVAIGDVVGDAHSDIVCTGANGSLYVFRGTGGGGFLGPIVLPALQSQGFVDLELADVDGDGDLDVIALGNAINASWVVVKNLGNQMFAPPATMSAGIYAGGIAVADLDGDARPEIVVCNAGAANTVRVYPNSGTGTYLAPLVLALGAGVAPNDVALADVDQDGDLDIVTSNGSSSIAVLSTQGASGLAAPAFHPTPAPNTKLVVGDWDNDGFPDVAVADLGHDVVALRNDGTGAFVAPVVAGTGATDVHGLASGDLDGDGRPDLVATDHAGQLIVMLGVGGGAFVSAPSVFTGGRFGAAVGDLDGDGRLDVAVALDQENRVGVLLGDGHGGFGRTRIPMCTTLAAFEMRDLDNDGRADVVAADGSSASVCVRLAIAGGGFGPLTSFPCGSPARELSLARVNADGFLDAVVMGADGALRVLFGDGLGGFSAPTAPVAHNGVQKIAAGDVNGDGLADLVIAFSYLQSGMYLVEGTSLSVGDGFGGFTLAVGSSTAAHSLLFADFDGDGIDEVVRAEGSRVEVWAHSGAGGFTSSTLANVRLGSLCAGDVNGDGRLDLFGVQASVGVELFIGNGAGGFAPMALAAAGQPIDLVVGDFDGDGLADALAPSNAGIQVLKSRSTPSMIDRGSIVDAAPVVHGMGIADVDGDQRPDLLVGSASPGEIVVVRNRGPYAAAVIYCTPKTTSNGCVPVMGSIGAPSVTSTSGFVLTCTNAINHKRGLLIYSLAGRAATPFQGGTLCLRAPILRSPGLDSHGNPPPDDCSGVYSMDFNAFAQGTAPGHPAPSLAIVGTSVTAQWWGRDPLSTLPGQSMLSNAIDFVMGP